MRWTLYHVHRYLNTAKMITSTLKWDLAKYFSSQVIFAFSNMYLWVFSLVPWHKPMCDITESQIFEPIKLSCWVGGRNCVRADSGLVFFTLTQVIITSSHTYTSRKKLKLNAASVKHVFFTPTVPTRFFLVVDMQVSTAFCSLLRAGNVRFYACLQWPIHSSYI